jgi:hypothetical protein
MFGTIRRHQKWLWAVIATLTITSFVVYFNPNSRYRGRGGGGGGSEPDLGKVDGEPVTRDAYYKMAQEVELYYFLTHGTWPDRDPDAKRQGFDEQREVYERLFLVKRAGDLGIRIGQEEVERAAGEILLSFQGRSTQAPSLDDFARQVLEPRGLTTGDLQRYLQDYLAIRALITQLGQGGRLTTPQEAELIYRRENEQISSEAVFFSASNYLNQVTVSPATLGAFFTNQMARYRLPDRVQVSYVRFPAEDFLVDADATIAHNTNFETQVEAIYQQRGTNYYADTTPTAAKAAIRKEFRQATALQDARKMAAAFADTLYDVSPVQARNLDDLAARSNLTVGATAPFDVQTGPAELNVPPDFARFAFKLTGDEPYAGPIVGEDAAYVIALKQQVPSEIPSFDSIRAKVASDYQLLVATQLARQAGTNFAATVGASLAQGKTFTAIAAAANVPVTKIPSFSLSTRSLPEVDGHISFGRLEDIAYGLPAGYVSPFVPTPEGGLLLHVLARTPVSDEKMRAELPAFLTQMRQTRENEAFQAWLMREAQTGLRDTPLGQRQAQPQ